VVNPYAPKPKLNTEEDLALLEKLANPAAPSMGDRLQTFGLGFTDAANRAYGGQGGNLDRVREDEVLKRRDAISNVLAGRRMKESDQNFEQGETARIEGMAERDRTRSEDRDFRREMLASDQAFQKAQAEANRRNQLAIAGMAKNSEHSEKLNKLFVPTLNQYALSEQDAKDTKDALTEFGEFEKLVDEMSALREKYGAEVFNRDAVAAGKALSKQALLKYKNVAGLGVLSKSDEAILDAIIPKDPLEFHLIGDPTNARLKQMKDIIESGRQAYLLERGFDPDLRSVPGQSSQTTPDGVPRAMDEEAKRKRLEELRAKRARRGVEVIPDKEPERFDEDPRSY
jgi:hypothetical protein